jgi:hypothetical protein
LFLLIEFRFHNQCAWNDLESAGNDNLLKMGSMVVGFGGDRFLLEWCLDSLESLVVVDGTNSQYMKTYIVTHL